MFSRSYCQDLVSDWILEVEGEVWHQERFQVSSSSTKVPEIEVTLTELHYSRREERLKEGRQVE